MKPYILLAVMILGFIAVIILAGYFLFIGNVSLDENAQIGQQTTPVPTQTQDPTAGWNTVTNTDAGITFKYPTDFGSKYASLQGTPLILVFSDPSSVKANGCLITENPTVKESQVTINNIQFCLGYVSDPGAGQLYNTSNYTTLHNGNYITLQYVVHTLNGCNPYMGTPDYGPCTDFMNNYDNLVVKTIENSVATLTFTK